MNANGPICTRCAQTLAPPAPEHAALEWSDRSRIRAQGWVGSTSATRVCLGCLSPDEANFLLAELSPPRDADGRFVLLPVAVAA